MKERAPKKTVYYSDINNDEFSRAKITPKRIDGAYPYLPRSPFFYLLRFFLYRLLATPIGFVLFRIKHGFRIRGRKKLKSVGKQGYFLYLNHTQEGADAFFPSFVSFPRSVYVVVHPNNVSQPLVGGMMRYLGALPLPDTFPAMKNFKGAIEKRVKDGCVVAIYPEAHIWPYFTDIRPFPATSFSFPVKQGSPVFSATVTYRKRRLFRSPRAVLEIDGPFYPDTALPERARASALRDMVYEAMKKRSALSDLAYIRYLPKSESEHADLTL